ncbi:MAG TPA: transposase [Candidatus Angelobacter sp.]|nr:transposase [Candidatus Angelobacter sp.]
METVKTLVQRYRPEPKLLSLMELFRRMVNRSIAIGLETGRTSLKSLSMVSYSDLGEFKTDSRYRLCAISRAAGILKNYRRLSKRHRVRTPYCRRAGLTICYGLKVNEDDGMLCLPGGFHIPLNKYLLRVLSEPGLRLRSATITESTINIAYTKETPIMECKGLIGVDRNLYNVTAVDNLGNTLVYNTARLVAVNMATRQTVARFKRDDNRIKRRIAGKYGHIRRQRTQWLLHNVSKKLVKHAGANRLGIVQENIKGIRRLNRKGNGQGPYYRERLNSWPFYKLDHQLSYKASWEGLPVTHVNPKGTTSKCSICGDHMVFSKESRMLRCPSCGLSVDRDVNAARNILSSGLRFSLKGLPSEAVRGNPTTMVIPRVDDSQPSHSEAQQ